MWFNVIIEFIPMLLILCRQIESDNCSVFLLFCDGLCQVTGDTWILPTVKASISRYHLTTFFFSLTLPESSQVPSIIHTEKVGIYLDSHLLSLTCLRIHVSFSSAQEQHGTNKGGGSSPDPPKRAYCQRSTGSKLGKRCQRFKYFILTFIH